jgi:hypothetical protein
MMLWRRERYDAMPKDITVKELVENDTSSIFVPDLHSAMPVLSQNQNIIVTSWFPVVAVLLHARKRYSNCLQAFCTVCMIDLTVLWVCQCWYLQKIRSGTQFENTYLGASLSSHPLPSNSHFVTLQQNWPTSQRRHYYLDKDKRFQT